MKTICFAAAREEHHPGMVEVPQKYRQLLRAVRSLRNPRINPNAGIKSYALLLTLPVLLDRIGMTA
jgi:hypothetical protein